MVVRLSSCSSENAVIWRGPASLGFLSSSRAGKKRRDMKVPIMRIKKAKRCCSEIRFRNKLFSFYQLSTHITFSDTLQ